MSQRIPIYIPTFISDQTYNPSRVLPHIYFYNGLIDCQTYYIESGSLTTAGTSYAQNAFPYFDNYNVVTGSYPTSDSLSLLFFNENASYGQTPIDTLYSTYWSQYVDLLYNPRTRLLNASAIIPLADYFKMELNDIVEWRGNYYHLRAINDYNLSNGECSIQLLGPVIGDVISNILPIYDCNFDFSVTTTTCDPCTDYRIQIIGGSGLRGRVDYTDCITNETASFTISSQVQRRFVGKNPVYVALGGGGTKVGPTAQGTAWMVPENVSMCTPMSYSTASLHPFTGSQSGGTAGFFNYSYIDASGSYVYVDADYYGGTPRVMQQGCYQAGAFPIWSSLSYSGDCGAPTTTLLPITITLTEKFKKAGPTYEVYYSDECNDYIYSETIQLVNIGDAVNLTVPNTSSCIKLVSLGDCSNAVVHVIPGALGGDFNIDFSFADFNVF